jgi:hypothetical protein
MYWEKKRKEKAEVCTWERKLKIKVGKAIGAHARGEFQYVYIPLIHFPVVSKLNRREQMNIKRLYFTSFQKSAT